jgi:ribose/xylose/arabinose/galactoside ABC-type transport system permease subunit
MRTRPADGAEGTAATAATAGIVRRWIEDRTALVALGVVLVVISAFTATQSDVFLTIGNLRNVLLQVSVLAIISSAMTLLMVSGGIDLSVGSMMSLIAIVAALLSAGGIPLPIAILVALLVGIVLGAINGALAAWSPSHPFVVTLGMGILIQGIAIQVTNGLPLSNLDPAFVALGSGAWLGVPIPVWIAGGVLLLCSLLLRYTVFGRHLYSMGGNERAAVLAGVRVRPTKVALYATSGLIVGVGALVLSARIASAQPLMGAGYEFQAIAAVAVGGTPLAGGRGGLLGTLLGVLLLGVISNSLNLLGVSGAFQYVLQGAVIVTAVMSQRSK